MQPTCNLFKQLHSRIASLKTLTLHVHIYIHPPFLKETIQSYRTDLISQTAASPKNLPKNQLPKKHLPNQPQTTRLGPDRLISVPFFSESNQLHRSPSLGSFKVGFSPGDMQMVELEMVVGFDACVFLLNKP